MKNIMIIISSIFLFGCSSHQPTNEDIIGVWIADDGAIFEIKDDHTLVFQNVSGNKMFNGFREYANRSFSGTGSWSLEQMNGRWIVRLGLYSDGVTRGGFSTRFDISGSNWLENRPPWYLFTFIGDPDNNERYSFHKKESNP